MRSWLGVATLCILGYGLILLLLQRDGAGGVGSPALAPVFPGLGGPQTATMLPQPADTGIDLAQHTRHGVDAVALLVTDETSSWRGLASGLLGIGLPYRRVASVAEARAHDMIIVYPRLSGATTSPEDLRDLAVHVREGGTLVAFAVLGGGLQEVFGFATADDNTRQYRLDFPSHALTRGFTTQPGEQQLVFGSAADADTAMPAVVYREPKLPPLAVFPDGGPAIVYNEYATAERPGSGRAVAVGVDLGHMLLRAHNARVEALERSYVNEYQPGTDTLLRLLAALYRDAEDAAILLSPTPEAREVTVLMTHDIDFTASLENAPVYAALERDAGIAATYFIQTKYVKDYNDDLFFDPARVVVLQQLQDWGMEVASHSVAHSNEFRSMPLGDGEERYPDYRPFVKDFTTVQDASILGELRVSRFLLESFIAGDVVSFRPGHLSLPAALPQLLQASGYRYSSSMTANEALTHLPFRSMYDRGYEALVDVHEFPVTIEDEADDLYQRLDAAVALTSAIARYHGVVNLLVHTETLGSKLDFVRDYIQAVRGQAWFGTLRDYGDWWRVRDTASLQVSQPAAGQRQLQLTVQGAISGLTLDLPDGWQLLEGPAGSQQRGNLLGVGAFTGSTLLTVQVPAPAGP